MDPKNASIRRRNYPRSRMQVVESKSTCPMCGDEGITSTWSPHEFDYGPEEASVSLQVQVPVRHCGACAFEYLDGEAERIKHGAVCTHLGVLKPDEIRRVREDQGMTRAAFAQLTGLGEASLNRWENGVSIQSHANDRYLRLLSQPGIMMKLQNIVTSRTSEASVSKVADSRFRVLQVTDVMRKEQAAFRLRRAA